MSVGAWLWAWPDGVVWWATDRFAVSSRRRRFELFMRELQPLPSWRVLYVGVSGSRGRATNFLEEWYPWPEWVTALGYGREGDFAVR